MLRPTRGRMIPHNLEAVTEEKFLDLHGVRNLLYWELLPNGQQGMGDLQTTATGSRV